MLVFSQPIPDTQKFKCKHCPEPEETTMKSASANIAVVADNNAKFSEYRGYNDNALLGDVSYEQQHRSEDRYLIFQANRLGNTNPALKVEAGRFGSYKSLLSFDQITRFQSSSVKTPYNGIETEVLTRPDDWNRRSTTTELMQVNSTGTSYDQKQTRKTFSIEFEKLFASKWQGNMRYRFQKKSGLKTTGAAIYETFDGARSVLLPEPIEYTTQFLNLSGGYNGPVVKLEGGYKGSLFKNENKKIRWDNLYLTGVSNEADEGQLALDPDNQFHQLYILGKVKPARWFNIKGQIAVGRMTQDEDYLPYSINNGLTKTTLPVTSLDGRVDTLNGNLRFNLKPVENLAVNVDFQADKKDNKTDQRSYQYASLDSDVSNVSRTNLPYGYHLYTAGVFGDYYFKNRSNINLGYKYLRKSRTYSEVGLAKTNRFWAKTNYRFSDITTIGVKLEKSYRAVSKFNLVPEIQPAQNRLMRKYHLADKDRSKASFTASSSLFDKVDLVLTLDYAIDEYSESELGLTEAVDLSAGLDLSYQIQDNIFINTYIHREQINAIQKNVDFDSSLWRVENTDVFTSIGFDVNWQKITDKLGVGSKLEFAQSTGEILPESNGSKLTKFPDLESNRMTLDLYAKYKFNKRLIVIPRFILESYSESDWYIDDVNFDSVGRILGTQQIADDYLVSLFLVSLNYTFE